MARALGINHVALEVGDLEAALGLYGRLFGFELRGRAPGMAFLDIGDQFLALSEGRAQGPDDGRHFGLVVDDKEAVRGAVAAEGLRTPGRRRARLPRPLGQPLRDRRLRRRPVRARARRQAQARHRAAREDRAGTRGDRRARARLTGRSRREVEPFGPWANPGPMPHDAPAARERTNLWSDA